MKRTEKVIILLVFLCLECVKLVSSLLYAEESLTIRLVRFLGLAFSVAMSVYAYQGKKFATLIMGFILMLWGLSSVIGSIFLFMKSHGNPALRVFVLLAGAYFLYGGIRFFVPSKTPKDGGVPRKN